MGKNGRANDFGVHRRALIGGAGAALLASQAMMATAATSRRHAGVKAGAKALPDGPVVETASGKLLGHAEGDVIVFKGVPYGASTAGKNRFRPPQPVKPWTGVREALSYGQICPQPSFPVLAEEDGSQSHEPQGEDCLLVHVWATKAAAKAPVMVWFHGGGYTVGGGSSPWYEGQNLAAKHGVVVVTVNHRLNVFGFLSVGAAAGPAFTGGGNAGMLDCVQALQWVKTNIAQFGGDPDNVTIFGESGGAGKVSTLMAMPAAKGLFHKAIAESGAALKSETPEAAGRSAAALMTQLGLGPNDVAKAQALPFETILAALGKLPPGASFGFGPVVDGVALLQNPFDPGAPAMSADIPFMTGSNLTETTFLGDTPLDPLDDGALLAQVKRFTRTDDAGAGGLIQLYKSQSPDVDNVFIYQLISSEYWMRAQVLTQAERKAAQPAPVYVYQFNRLSAARDGKLHCPHGSEIPFVFDNLAQGEPITGVGPEQQALADRMSAAWVSFARTGKPASNGLPDWPVYNASQRAVMVFDDQSRIELDPLGKGRMAIAELKARQA